ncbi:hypothetical protein MTR67_034561 [Solanum verrucosum]|uniref:Uncharacterized protein n=1 Tax=Solanum verrucosum TaxID=315347 RepID=A0AAF0ZIU8_SOLVR|nr:hypothetical protein MTR67_034561 [Solanum verrucosum]
MPNYGREQLNPRFSITIHRTQYSELKKFNDSTHFKNARLRGFMQNYGHELPNSRTQRYNIKRVRNSILKTQNLRILLLSKMLSLRSSHRIYGHERLDSRVYITIWN